MSGLLRVSTARVGTSSWLFLLALLPLLHPAVARAAEAPTVVVEKAREVDVVRQVPLSGTVTSARVSRLSPEISGQVASLKVDFGDRVEAGDELLVLDSEIGKWEYQASQAQTEQLRAELVDAKRRYADAQLLRERNTISENEIQLRKAEVAIREATLKRQEAEEKQQQARLEQHVLRAPFGGVISDKRTEVGEWVVPGTAVLELVSLDTLHADFSVPQAFYPHINDDTRITLTLDAVTERQFEGRIDAVVPVNDRSARTFMLRVLFDSINADIIPGMSVSGLLQVSSKRRGIVVSRDAVLRYPDGRITVWVVHERDGKLQAIERRVTTGHGFDGVVEIREGLEAGDIVVVEGNEALEADQAIRIEQRDGEG
jgi:membrane fusion protein, multidrug efflux system